MTTALAAGTGCSRRGTRRRNPTRSDLRLVVGLVFRLLHNHLVSSVGSSRLARLVELTGLAALVGGYVAFLQQAIRGTSSLDGAPIWVLLTYTILVTVASSVTVTAGLAAVDTSQRSKLESALRPLPIEPRVLKAGLLSLPLALAFIISSVPMLAMTSVFLKVADPSIAIRIICVAIGLALSAALVATTMMVIHLLAAQLARVGAGHLATPIAAVAVLGATISGVAWTISSFDPQVPFPGVVRLTTLLLAPLPAVAVLLAVAAGTVLAGALLMKALTVPIVVRTRYVFVLTRRRGHIGWFSVALRQLVREPNVVSTLFLAAAAIALAGLAAVVGSSALTSLPAAGLFVVPFIATFAYPATAAARLAVSISPTSQSRLAVCIVAAVAAVIGTLVAVIAGVGAVVDSGMGPADVAEAIPFLIIAATISLWVGLLIGGGSDSPATTLLSYLCAIGATIACGIWLGRLGVLDSLFRVVLVASGLLGSLTLQPAVARRMQRRIVGRGSV